MSVESAQHPLIDGAGEDWVATETRDGVIALSVAMSDFLSRVSADRRRPLVVSDEHARMTQPLAEALAGVRGHWVVRASGGGFYDTRTGVALERPEDVLTLGAHASRDGVHPLFLRSSLSSRLQVAASVATRHRVSRPVRLGGVLEAASETFSGTAPTAWGPTEPLVAPWNRDDITEFSRTRVPTDSRWAAVTAAEHRSLGTLQVARTSEGIEETTHTWADVSGPNDPRGESMGQDAREFLARAAGVGMPLLGVAFAAIGPADLTRRSTAALPPQPLALLVGPPGVRALGVDAKTWAAIHGGAVVGSPRLPGVLLSLGGVAGGGWERLSSILDTLDADRLHALLGIAPHIAAQLRRTESEG